jgi:hypothetical protein
MDNNYTTNQKGLLETIAFQRINESKDLISANNKEKRGVLVIDPNKMIDVDNNILSDRFIKQEDLTIYCSLKVFKKEEISVVNDGSGSTIKPESAPILINMLNPLKKNGDHLNRPEYKNKFTTEWTDYFTKDSSSDKTSESFIIDPETFGINNISYSLNANLRPHITITFIDVQGRMLFERGNNVDNPYNIFFTYPYPKFLLSFKGYYGKTVEVPLALLRSNYKFDAQTGNYMITCEMESDIFAMLNTLLIIYAYAAPYMFITKDGDYLGSKILRKLYDKQNKEFKNRYGDGTKEYQAREIINSPTLWDLANAIKKIPYNALNNPSATDSPAQSNDEIIKNKMYIQQFDIGIRNFFNDDNKYIIELQTKKSDIGLGAQSQLSVFRPKSNGYKLDISNKTPSDLFDIVQQINQYIAKVNDTANQLQRNEYIAKFKSNIKNYIPSPDMVNLIKPELFYFDDGDVFYSLDNFNSVMLKFYELLDLLQNDIEELNINTKIEDISKYLGYQPNMNNVIRIISNNMQTFFILMEIVSRNALKQIKTDPLRGVVHKNKTTHKTNFDNNINFYSPFPNYYQTITESINGETQQHKVLAFPGSDEGNKEWFEVQFIEEFYDAITRLNRLANPIGSTAVFGAKKTGLMTLFALGEDDLLAYENKTASNEVVLEMLKKYSLHLSLSGLMYRGMDVSSFKTNYAKPMADFELKVQDEMIFQNLSTNAKFLLGNTIKNTTQKNGTETNFGYFGRNYLILVDGEAGYNRYVNNIARQEIMLLRNNYTKTEYDAIISLKNEYLNKNVKNNIYKKLYDTNFSPKKYSITQPNGKESELKVIINLNSNKSYYSVDSSNLNNINEGLKTSMNDNNVFQGYINKMNKSMNETKVNTSFDNNVTVGLNKTPAITFSSPITDDSPIFVKIDSLKDFSKYNNI